MQNSKFNSCLLSFDHLQSSTGVYNLKRTVLQDLLLLFFLWIIFSQASDNNITLISNFFLENSRRYLQVKVHHWYQRHGWQICRQCQLHRRQICHQYQRHQWQIKVNLKKKFIYMLTLLLKGVKKCKNFLIEDIWFATGVTRMVHLMLRISPQIFEKIWNGPNGILWGGGGENWFMKKTWCRKSRDTVPLIDCKKSSSTAVVCWPNATLRRCSLLCTCSC
jgi:hypothetical protein